MSCGLLDDYKPIPNAHRLDADSRWVTLHVRGHAVAVEEGLLVPYEFSYEGKAVEVFFTDRLYAKFSGSPVMMKRIAETGLDRLCRPHKKDNEYLKRRVLREYNLLVVQDRYGVTFMETSDF